MVVKVLEISESDLKGLRGLSNFEPELAQEMLVS